MVADRCNEKYAVKWFSCIGGFVWKCNYFDQGILEFCFVSSHLISHISFLYCDGICLVSLQTVGF